LEWLAEAYSTISEKLLDPALEYPCHFGVQGQQLGHNWFTAVDAGRPGYGVDTLAATLLAFRARAREGPRRQSLIAFVGPPEPAATLAAEHARFWALLGTLTARDPAPWPDAYPRDTTDPGWRWCFAGDPWFVFAASPAYRARRSRNLGPCLTVVFQTDRVFQGLAGTTTAGRAAKRVIRARLASYDLVPPHPHLGDQQLSSVHKWRQYALPDDQEILRPEGCPFR
jgi:FPC/CPF motif-containing protein YcgG